MQHMPQYHNVFLSYVSSHFSWNYTTELWKQAAVQGTSSHSVKSEYVPLHMCMSRVTCKSQFSIFADTEKAAMPAHLVEIN